MNNSFFTDMRDSGFTIGFGSLFRSLKDKKVYSYCTTIWVEKGAGAHEGDFYAESLFVFTTLNTDCNFVARHELTYEKAKELQLVPIFINENF